MANARTCYDAITEALVREHGARRGAVHGRACLMLDDTPFLQFAPAGLAVRLYGRVLAEALALPGARRHDPFEPGNTTAARPGWVFVPAAQYDAWATLATEALHCAAHAHTQRVSWSASDPSASPPAAPAPARSTHAERAAAALANGFGFDLER